MKIMLIALNTSGGMIHYVSQLANALSKREDVVVIAPVGVERKNFTEDMKIIELQVGNVIKNFFINTLIVTRPIRFLNMIYKEKPDIVHCSENHLWLSPFLPFLTKFPIVTTIHDVNPHPGDRKFDRIIGKKIHMKFSDCLIVHGEKAKKELKTDKTSYVIPHGDYSFLLNYKDERVKEENAILFFGRILKYKGIEYLIKAESLITSCISDAKIIIAGSGNFKKYEYLIKNRDNFEIHNRFIPDNEVAEFFQRSCVIALPYTEGSQTGIIPIAYSFKKPVVVTDVGSIPEAVDDGKTGFIVPPRDVSAFAGAIIKLLKDEKLRKRMGENAYKKMKNNLSWDKIAEKTIEVYKEAINEHKNKRRENR